MRPHTNLCDARRGGSGGGDSDSGRLAAAATATATVAGWLRRQRRQRRRQRQLQAGSGVNVDVSAHNLIYISVFFECEDRVSSVLSSLLRSNRLCSRAVFNKSADPGQYHYEPPSSLTNCN